MPHQESYSYLFTAVLFIFALSACSSKSLKENGRNTMTIMTFNVENLFDTRDDKGKKDETYLPLSLKKSEEHQKLCNNYRFKKWQNECKQMDWSEEVVQSKLKNLGKSIAQVNDGLGPDIIVFQEVENQHILKRLRDEQLSEMNYKEIVLIEGRDKRGIDIAMLSKLPLIKEASLHQIPFTGFPEDRVEDTRGILQADFQLPDGEPLTVFGVHFPAPYHPVQMREQAFQFMTKLKSEIPKENFAIAAGDFNVPAREDAKTDILNKYASDDWLISHRIGCKGCRGTNYYKAKKSWSFLDMILLSKNFQQEGSGWKVLPETVRIVNHFKQQVTAKATPKRFNPKKGTGVSDHWPLAVDISTE